ncbi:hypothetical protein K443DRAFT_134901 [Laccaria amethystina LaAM-08-1]|uniref:Uncharacterized protein n=1 Tax=Laccaria amethystina LaAM-08-1 TaxID=1095629 RepID=A0A0C9WJ27_9AGAR|nr:hypothetical protein K443DRAFT_134901 [Laccaria amethystina LaAM-08-1]
MPPSSLAPLLVPASRHRRASTSRSFSNGLEAPLLENFRQPALPVHRSICARPAIWLAGGSGFGSLQGTRVKFFARDSRNMPIMARLCIQTWDTLLSLIGAHNVPGLPRIFRNAKFCTWSAERLLEIIQKALAGKYCPQNYSELELDLSAAIYELGGGAALHALHNSPFAFPPRTTLLGRRRDFRLQISVSSAMMVDLLANIKTMFKDIKPGHKKVGITLSMDEIASDTARASELPSVKMGDNLDVVRNIARAVKEGLVHIGQEVFVAAFARNDEADYGAKPQGSFRESVLIIEMLRQAWRLSPCGESLHGPIWSIASDGDPKRRPALYLHCMVQELTPGQPLFRHVGMLPGLNLWTGSGGETQDLDYKHNFKRICKCLCAREGILIDGVVINKGLLALWLERLTDLLKLSADVRNLGPADFDPSERSTHRSLSLLGEMLEALVEPFINPKISISQRITSLVKFCHIACALFLKHESGFMPHHLYSDLQCMVRAAIFRAAHTKSLDPSLKLFLIAQAGNAVQAA